MHVIYQAWDAVFYKKYYGKPLKRDWVARVVFLIQILLIFGCRCNRYFWDIGLKIYRLPNFNMLFQLVQTQFFENELFSCLPKGYHVINWWKRPISLSSRRSELRKSGIKFPASWKSFISGMLFTLYESFAWQTLTSLGLSTFARIACLLQLRIETNDLEYSIWATPV